MRIFLNDKIVTDIIEKARGSNNSDIKRYIAEVSVRCVKLCNSGEHFRVLNEFKFMLENLIQILDI